MYYSIYDYSYWKSRPTPEDFSIEIISDHPDFKGRALKQYAAEGINTIGVYGDEAFRVHFNNKSFEDVQVRISLDGTDILTGKPANLEVNHEMWVVRAGRTLHLKAWAENSQGGARFVFTSGDKSVALHAHGDISHKGMISAAVFTERDRPYTPRLTTNERIDYFNNGGPRRSLQAKSSGLLGASKGGISFNSVAPVPAGASAEGTYSASLDMMEDLKKEASVGAGEYVDQKTRTVKGLDNPILNSIVRVRYMWWDDLQAKLKDARFEDPHPTGFPGEKIKTFADLSNVPRVTSAAATRVEARVTGSVAVRNEQSFDRFI